MNEKESVENIVTAITQMFDRFILVDLDEDKYEYIIEDENKKLPESDLKVVMAISFRIYLANVLKMMKSIHQ